MPGVSLAVDNFNKKFLGYCEYWDEFIMESEQRSPNVWRDRLPKGTFQLYNGITQKSNIYRGGLGPQAGLSEWTAVATSTPGAEGYNACGYDPNTYAYGVETVSYSGFRTSWASPVVCLQDLKYTPKIREQLAMITRTGTDVTSDVKETFSREIYVKTAVDSGKAVIFTDGGMDYLTDSTKRFSYDPFVKDADQDTYISFPAGLKVSTLNWSYLDYLRMYMADQCPQAALGNDSGMPLFGLFLDLNDFEKFVLGTDSKLREDFRYADPKALIKGFNMGLKVFRGFMLMHDSRQMRFKFHKISSGNVIAKRVKPRKADRAATIGYIPEANPAYYKAELAIGVIFMNDVIQIQMPPNDLNMGSGMVFGPAPGYNGEWTWINEYDKQYNPLREVGYFFSRFEYYPKPLLYSSEATVFLYARCPQTWTTECEPIADGSKDPVDSAFLAEAPAAGDFDGTNLKVTLTLTDKLSAATPGSPVTVTNDASAEFAAVIADASMAPTYVIAWVSGGDNVPSAVTEINDPTKTKVTVG